MYAAAMNVLYFILLSLFWGGSFIGIKFAIEGYHPFLAAAIRILIALIIAAAYIAVKKVKFPPRRIALKATFAGFIGLGLPWLLLFWGEQYVEPALASIINATTPLFTILFAIFLLKRDEEPITWNRMMGIVLGFIGIFVIFGPYVGTHSYKSVMGLLAIVGMALFYGLSIVVLKSVTAQAGNMIILFYECIGGALIVVPVTIVAGFREPLLTGEPLLVPSIALLYLGIFSSAIAMMLFYSLMRSAGSLLASAVTYTAPIVAITLDWLILGEWIGSQALFGALIIFAGLRLIKRPVISPAVID